MSVQAPAPLTIFREAVSRGDRADAVLGASELVLRETGGGASLEYVERRLCGATVPGPVGRRLRACMGGSGFVARDKISAIVKSRPFYTCRSLPRAVKNGARLAIGGVGGGSMERGWKD